MKKTKLAGIVLWLLGICLYFYPDVATDLQEIKVQAFVKTYEREHKSRRRSVQEAGRKNTDIFRSRK